MSERQFSLFLFWALVFGPVIGIAAPALMGSSEAIKSPKKTLCTMTINSVQEKDLFRRYLPKGDFDVVELVPEVAPGLAWIESWNQQSWFKKSCDKRIQCDILVISGHFAGSFFGRSGYSLSLEEMERASCDSSCNGIFKRPKEVYLFGCNTLADKSRDHRSPEDYVNVLRADGFSAEEAHAVAMQRYTPWGGSNIERMRSLFPAAAGLYGFKSTSPLGKNIEPSLSTYLKTKGPRFSKDLDQMQSGDRNLELARALKAFSFAQAEPASQGETPLVCELTAPGADSQDLIFDQLASGEPLRNLPQVLQGLREMEAVNPQQLTQLKQRLQGLNRDIKAKFAAIFASEELKAHLSIRLGLIELQQILFLETASDSKLEKSYQGLMRTALLNVSEHTAREFCGTSSGRAVRSFEIPTEVVDEAAKKFAKSKAKTESLFGALACLRTSVNLAWIAGNYPSHFLFAQNWNPHLGELKKKLLFSKSTNEQNRLLGVLLSNPRIDSDLVRILDRRLGDSKDRRAILSTLSQSPKISEAWQLYLVTKTIYGSGKTFDDEGDSGWVGFWRQVRPTDEDVQRALHAGALSEREPALPLAVFSSGRVHPQILREWMKGAETGAAVERSFNLNLLMRLSPDGDGLYEIGLRRLTDADIRVRVEAEVLILRFFSEVFDPVLERRMTDLLKDSSENVASLAFRFWAKRGSPSEEVIQEMFAVWSNKAADSALRSSATDVFEHLSVSSPSVIQMMEERLARSRRDSTEQRQLVRMLAAARWSNGAVAGPDYKATQSRLKQYFERQSKSSDDQMRLMGRKAMLRNTKPDEAFLKSTSRDLIELLEAQNWMGARILAYELEPYRSSKSVNHALKRFQTEIDATLDGEL